MGKMVVAAPAKLNLSLDIVGRREDGYHLLQTVMQSVSIYDIVTLEECREEGITLSCPALSGLPVEKNIAYRAADAFFCATGLTPRLKITVDKQIPWGAGLGGGSADGAGVLWGLRRMYRPEMPLETLCEIGLSVGADVPFCLLGGTALAEGIGEVLSPLPLFLSCYFVVVKPPMGIETAKAYAAYDGLEVVKHPDTQGLINAIRQGNPTQAASLFFNVLQAVTNVPEWPVLCRIAKETGGTQPVMTGSGSAFFSLHTDPVAAEACCAQIKAAGIQAFVCTPVAHGPMKI